MNQQPPSTAAAPPRPAWKARLRRWLVILALTQVVAYLLLLGLLYTFQARIIFPNATSQGQSWAAVKRPPPGTELVTIRTRHGVRIGGLFGAALGPDGRPHPAPRTRPTVLYFYGNGDCLSRCVPAEHRLFREHGCNVLICDYPGYGISGGTPSEVNCYAMADAAYAYLLTRPEVDPKRIATVGFSLGGAIAIDLAARRPVCALATSSTFTTMAEVGAAVYPVPLEGLILRHRFESSHKIGRVRCPILICHGTADRVVPPLMAEGLARLARPPVERIAVPGAGHVVLFLEDGSEAQRALFRLLDTAP